MTQQLPRHRLLTLLVVIGSLALVGVTPALADELPADGGQGDACSQRTADAFEDIDAYEASLSDTEVVSETDMIRRVQAVVSQLNFDLSRMDCATTASGPGAIDGATLAPPCDSTSVPVAGQSELVREDHAKQFSGANEVVPAVDSAIAGYPVTEAHAKLFAGADAETLAVDSSIAGYPVAEAHAKLFAGVDKEC